jgi:adenylate cyclase
LISQLGAVSGILLTAAVMVGTVVIDQIYFFQNGLVIAIIFPVFLIGGLYVSLTFYKYFTEERGKKELKQTFQKYVSPAVVDEILADPGNIELGGKKLRLTVFFSDVRGFTTISEKLDPRALSDLLNSYLTPMTELVFQNRGTLDKYMGDAIMAFFGAPIQYPDHAKFACRCALQSLEKLKELQERLKAQGLPIIDIGIGLNTGDMSVGNMGSETVRSYTVMGDAVNLGSRLEGINKEYGTRIIISEFTYAEVKDSFVCREIDWVRVKGKVLPVKIYELMSEKPLDAEMQTMLEHFQTGYELYHQRQFEKALHEFNTALMHNPEDPVSKLYLERCEDFIAEPPPENWDGVFVMKTK